VGDVRERPAVDEGRSALEGLEQVRLDRVDQQDGHGACDADVLARDRLAARRRRQDDPSESGPQVVEVRGKGEHRHDLRRHRDHPLRLTRDAVLPAAQADDRATHGPVADVDDPWPEDRERIDAVGIAVMKTVVEERGGEVVGGADGVDVAGEVEVEVLHRDDLAVAAARRAALDPEHGAERWLTDADGRPMADVVEALAEADSRRRLALSERRRRDRGDDDVLAARPLRLDAPDALERDLRLRPAVQLDLVVAQTEVRGNVRDQPGGHRPCDLQVGRERHRAPRVDERCNAATAVGGLSDVPASRAASCA
jgi:hypothetical protein